MEPIKLAGLEPKAPLGYFEKFCSIPHGSDNTKGISDYLVSFAKEHELEYVQDEYNNVIIFGEATCGYDDHEPVAIQGHIDMVCEKDANCTINMDTDPLDLTHDGTYIYAKGTTLGADDGVAAALGLALLADKSIPRPALALICTADEETTMEGAKNIDLSVLKGRRLINIDTGAEGMITVACAGGARADITVPVQREMVYGPCVTLTVENLEGGHSGSAIHKGRANANKVMAEFLRRLQELIPVRITQFKGGNKSNAIPRSCEATLFAPDMPIAQINQIAQQLQDEIRSQYSEPYVVIRSNEIAPQEEMALTTESSTHLIALLGEIPYGVLQWDPINPKQVQTSMNIGVVALKDELEITASARSSVNAEKADVMAKVQTMVEAHGGKSEIGWQCSAWEFKKDSPLQDTMKRVYKEMYGKDMIVRSAHGILECGTLCEKLPDVDCVAIGPFMYDLHTSRERLDIASFNRTWEYLKAVMKAL